MGLFEDIQAQILDAQDFIESHLKSAQSFFTAAAQTGQSTPGCPLCSAQTAELTAKGEVFQTQAQDRQSLLDDLQNQLSFLSPTPTTITAELIPTEEVPTSAAIPIGAIEIPEVIQNNSSLVLAGLIIGGALLVLR